MRKYLLLITLLFTVSIQNHTFSNNSFRVYGMFMTGTEEEYSIQQSSANNPLLFGGGISYARNIQQNSHLFHTLDINLQTTVSLKTFLFIDAYVGYGLGFMTKAGKLTFDIIGLGVTVSPFFNKSYEYLKPPFTLYKGEIPSTANIGVLINIIGVQWTGAKPYGYYIAWRNFININVYNGLNKEIAKIGAELQVPTLSNYDRMSWDIAIRTSIIIGFDFVSLSGKTKDLRRREI